MTYTLVSAVGSSAYNSPLALFRALRTELTTAVYTGSIETNLQSSSVFLNVCFTPTYTYSVSYLPRFISHFTSCLSHFSGWGMFTAGKRIEHKLLCAHKLQRDRRL